MNTQTPTPGQVQAWRDLSGPVRRITYGLREQFKSDGYDTWTERMRVRIQPMLADVVSSEVENTRLHAPCIDIDYPAALIPSSTPGHYHLYLNKTVTWRQYKRVLRAMAKSGLIEEGYYKASKNRGGTHLRLPWVKKGV